MYGKTSRISRRRSDRWEFENIWKILFWKVKCQSIWRFSIEKLYLYDGWNKKIIISHVL